MKCIILIWCLDLEWKHIGTLDSGFSSRTLFPLMKDVKLCFIILLLIKNQRCWDQTLRCRFDLQLSEVKLVLERDQLSPPSPPRRTFIKLQNLVVVQTRLTSKEEHTLRLNFPSLVRDWLNSSCRLYYVNTTRCTTGASVKLWALTG